MSNPDIMMSDITKDTERLKRSIKRQRTKVYFQEKVDSVSREVIHEQLIDVIFCLAKEAGFSSIESDAKDLLLNVFFSYWQKLLRNTKSLTELAGHNAPTMLDVASAMQSFRIDPITLISPPIIPNTRIIPERIQEKLEDAEFLHSDSEDLPEAAGTKLHIYAPEYCPPLPPRHTFRNTTTPGIPKGSLEYLEEKALRRTGLETSWERLLLNTMKSGAASDVHLDPLLLSDISDIQILRSKCTAIDFAKDRGSNLNWAQDRYKSAKAVRLWSI